MHINFAIETSGLICAATHIFIIFVIMEQDYHPIYDAEISRPRHDRVALFARIIV